MKKYHIRYNVKHRGSGLIWRVFEEGVEFKCKDIKISVPCYGESTFEEGEIKYNIACEGNMTIIEDIAYIK